MKSQGQETSSARLADVLPDEEQIEDETHVKIHVLWDVDVEKYKSSNFQFTRDKLSLNLLSGLSEIKESVSIDEIDLCSEIRSSCVWPPEEETLQDAPMPAERHEMDSIPIFPSCEAYAFDAKVEYFSITHGVWLSGRIDSHGLFSNEACKMPSYTVTLRTKSHQRWQQRDYVQLSHLRIPFEKNSKVNVFDETTGDWLPAFVERYRTYPFPLAYGVKLEGDANCSSQSSGIQGQQTVFVVPAHNVRPLFEVGDTVRVYLGIVKGWVKATICSNSMQTWPHVAVELRTLAQEVLGTTSNAGGQFLSVLHYEVRHAIWCSI